MPIVNPQGAVTYDRDPAPAPAPHPGDPRPQLHAAVLTLSERDPDRAGEQNGVGWNGHDSNFGHVLAEKDWRSWTPKMTRIAWEMTRKYSRQLASVGIDWAAIPEPPDPMRPPAPAPLMPTPTAANPFPLPSDEAVRQWRAAHFLVELVTSTSGPVAQTQIVVRFPYQADLVAAIRTLPGRKYEASDRSNRFPLSPQSVEAVIAFAAEHQFTVTPEADEAMERVLADRARLQAEQQAAIELSQAEDAAIDIPGLGGELKPFQRAGVKYALEKQRTFIADEMGLGKTVQALAVIQHVLKDDPKARAIVICPASLKLNWTREAIRWLPEIVTMEGTPSLLGKWGHLRVRGVSILNSTARDLEMRGDSGDRLLVRTNDLRSRILILNYDILDKHMAMLMRLKAEHAIKVVIFDESHYAKNVKAKRTKLSQQLAEGIEYRLNLTGTPVMNRPKELLSQLNILSRLDDFGGFYSFVNRYCRVEYIEGDDHSDLLDLNKMLRATCFVRRRKADVLSELDPKTRTTLPLEIDNRGEYERCLRDLVNFLRDKAASDERFQAYLDSLEVSADEKAEMRAAYIQQRAAAGAGPAAALVMIENLKQITARGKIKAVLEWIEDFIETGEKLVVFATHKNVVAAIAERFSADTITGETSMGARDKAVQRFQTDPASRVIVGNIKAMGTGLTLTAASNVAFIELDWTPAAHDQAEDRCHRIGQQDAVTAYYLLGDRTIDEDIADLIDRKRRVVNATTDGITTAKDRESILGDLIDRLVSRSDI